MTPELQNKLYEKYPDLFKDKDLPMSETCMCWGIDVGDGWYHILDNMCERISQVQEQYDVKVKFTQVKEKYATLRVYHDYTLGDSWTYTPISFWETFNTVWNRYLRPFDNIFGNSVNNYYRNIRKSYNKFKGESIIWNNRNGIQGGNKVYAIDVVDNIIDDIIHTAELMTEFTCESCGVTGATINEKGIWKSCRCEKCRSEGK